jgi:GTP-binding protein Era
MKSGFACFVGRPNAGKSTLTNALVGEKIAIASSKPQTTRHVVRGIVNTDDAQLIVVDTPGLHKPRTLLGERLNDLVHDTWAEVDVIGVCLPSNQRVGPGDTYLVAEIAKLPKRPKLVALATKSDLVSKPRLAEHLLKIASLEEELGIRWEAIVPVSALTDDQVDVVADELIKLLPDGPKYFPDGEVTDEPTETRIAELIREAALEGVHDELPHSLMVVIDEMGERPDRPADKPLLDIFASMIVERDSQKGIVIGHKGERLKQIGTVSRLQIAELVGMPVHLDLRVKVLKEWQRNPKHLNRLGF